MVSKKAHTTGVASAAYTATRATLLLTDVWEKESLLEAALERSFHEAEGSTEALIAVAVSSALRDALELIRL